MKSHKLTHAAADIASQPVPEIARPSGPAMLTLDQAIVYLLRNGSNSYECSRWSRMNGIELFLPAMSRHEIRVSKATLDEFLQPGRPAKFLESRKPKR